MRRPPINRPGFTLIEVLIAILIVGILVAMLLPAVNGVMRRARESGVSAEELMLSTNLASFVNRYGDNPPSRFICSENGDYSTAALAAPGKVGDPIAFGLFGLPWASLTPGQQATATAEVDRAAVESLTTLRSFWPKVLASRSGAISPITAIGWYDFNGNGVQDLPYLLTGDECLVWFLGGIPKPYTSTSGAVGFGMIGFANNTKNPFLPDAYNGITPPRNPSIAEFRAERLVDDDGDGIPWYSDMYDGVHPSPYAYFRAENGTYNPRHCDRTTEPNGDPSPVGAFAAPALGSGQFVTSPAPNPYTLSTPYPTTGANYATATLATNTSFTASWANPNSYQIIASGADRQFGPGGWWDSGAKDTRVPFARLALQVLTGTLLGGDARNVERDNVANFANGRLD